MRCHGFLPVGVEICGSKAAFGLIAMFQPLDIVVLNLIEISSSVCHAGPVLWLASDVAVPSLGEVRISDTAALMPLETPASPNHPPAQLIRNDSAIKFTKSRKATTCSRQFCISERAESGHLMSSCDP